MRGLDPHAALELVASYDRKALNDESAADLKAIAEDYGLDLESLDPAERRTLLTMYVSLDQTISKGGKAELARAMNELMHEKLVAQANGRLDDLQGGLNRAESLEDLKTKLRETMRSMHALARQVSPEKEENMPAWLALYDRFKELQAMKRAGKSPEFGQVFEEVFDEFGGFIEDEFVVNIIKKHDEADEAYYIEDLMQQVYGRTEAESEALKRRNREAVVAEITRLKDDPEVTIEMLERLHELNNRGVVPKDYSKIRSGNRGTTFGSRVGTLAEDVQTELGAVLTRAENLVAEEMVQGVSDVRYEIAAARIHNDFLDIHPFSDRNGSTALLLLEVLMSKKGYVPSEERSTSYYSNLLKILGNNPLAVAVVGYQHYKIAHQPGFYEGKTITEEKRGLYEYMAKEQEKYVKKLEAEAKEENRRRKSAAKARKKGGKEDAK